ncbi:hypothetical protein [Kamptonema formosum]|uniref:hypothetical protein n=1 Tax=Kamptonema formosum TaxID=331992 RepID=UPI0009E4164B|nr:hypothetical protein [Oscillatoria sp. PCC 10802]
MTWTLTGSPAIEPVAPRKHQYSTLARSYWAWGTGHGAPGMGHQAWGTGHGALTISPAPLNPNPQPLTPNPQHVQAPELNKEPGRLINRLQNHLCGDLRTQERMSRLVPLACRCD